MNKIFKAEDLPEKETVFLKKSFDGYRVVYPLKKEDGTWDWFVLLTGGTWWVLLKTFLVIALLLFVTWSYIQDTTQCRDLVENICDYRIRINEACTPTSGNNPLAQLNLSGLNIDGI